MKLLLYGQRSQAEEIARFLAENKGLLQDPFKAMPGADTCNTLDSDAAQCAEGQAQRPCASRDMLGEHKSHHTAESEMVRVDGRSLVRSDFKLARKAAANPEIPPATEARKRKRVVEDTQEEHRGPSREQIDRLVSECVSTMERCGASTIALSRKYVLCTTKVEIQTSVRKLGVLQGMLIACIQELMSGRSYAAQDPNDLSMANTGASVEITQQNEDGTGLQALSWPMERVQSQLVGKNARPKVKCSKLKQKNADFKEEITQLKQMNAIFEKLTGLDKKMNAELSKQARELKEKNASLKMQNTELKQERAELKGQNIELKQMDTGLSEQNIELNLLFSNHEEQNAQLKSQEVRLKEDIAELREQIQKHESGHIALVVKAGECNLERYQAAAEKMAAIDTLNQAIVEKEEGLTKLQRIGSELQIVIREGDEAMQDKATAHKDVVAKTSYWSGRNRRTSVFSQSRIPSEKHQSRRTSVSRQR